jgi:hypothetical protein
MKTDNFIELAGGIALFLLGLFWLLYFMGSGICPAKEICYVALFVLFDWAIGIYLIWDSIEKEKESEHGR